MISQSISLAFALALHSESFAFVEDRIGAGVRARVTEMVFRSTAKTFHDITVFAKWVLFSAHAHAGRLAFALGLNAALLWIRW